MEDIILRNGDCLEIMKEIDDKSIDLVLIDPPYGVDFDGGFDDSKEYVKELMDNFSVVLRNKLKDDAHIYIFVPTKEIKMFLDSFRSYNLMNILSTRTYTNSTYSKNNYNFNNQLILFYTKFQGPKFHKELNKVDFIKTSNSWLKDKRNKNPKEFTYNYPSIFPDDIFSNEKANAKRKNMHPCQKNVKLEEILIKLSSKENDVVLDAFMGSGSTGIACINTNRKFYGIEKDEHYFDVAKNRIEEHLKGKE